MTDNERRTPHPEPIPEFHSREEEAAFWDSHDLADYWDTFKPVRARFNKQLSEGITVRLDPETLSQLRERAHALGIGPTTLARMWILEHLRGEQREKSEV
jgi:CopG antitoxin of type II toxin-antitoxin system